LDLVLIISYALTYFVAFVPTPILYRPEYFPYYHASQIFPDQSIEYQFEAIKRIREEHMQEIIDRSGGLIKNVKPVYYYP
jgi:hypothetical protein